MCEARRHLLAMNADTVGDELCGRVAMYEVEEEGMRKTVKWFLCQCCFELMAEGNWMKRWRKIDEQTWHASDTAPIGERL